MGPHLIFNASSELLPFVAKGCIVTRDLGFIKNSTKCFFLLAYYMSLTIIPWRLEFVLDCDCRYMLFTE